jgi:D-3-phosphoglycerate dehydrogenase / 2-oxoglutarate reductase
MMRILLTHTPDMLANYYGERALGALRALGEVRLNGTGEVLDAPALIAEAAHCDIVISDRQTPGYAAFFAAAPQVVAFLRCAVDIRTIDVKAASEAGILITRATPGFAAAVAEVAIGMMVDLARHITAAVIDYRAGREPIAQMGRQLAGSTVGIIGYGVIGQYLVRLAQALGMMVLVSDPHKTIEGPDLKQVELEALLRQADFVVCLAVATPETENLMNAAAFALMRSDAYFVNLSRGDLVDEAALARTLDEGRIAGAAMDVGRAPDQKPSLNLARRTNVIATPHIAGLTRAAVEHQAFDTVAQVRAIVAGEMPPGAVNPEHAVRLKGRIGAT